MSEAIQTTEPTGAIVVAALEIADLKEAVEANLQGMERISFERVKIPAGGGLAFEVLDDDGQPQPTSELKGIIIDRYPVNAYWADAFSGENNPPACSALDGHNGVGEPGGLCVKCPMNQWGSDTRSEGAKGKACKNLHRIFIMAPDEILPRLLTLPPTSLGNFNSYLVTLTKKARPFYSVLTRVKLEKASNAGGITYSRAVFSRAGDVPLEKIPALRAYIKDLTRLTRGEAIVADDYDTEQSEADSAEPTNQPF